MAPITTVALRALERLGGPRIVLAAVPGGIRTMAAKAGVSRSRVSQVLRQDPLPREWAELAAQLIGCGAVEVYQQLGQKPPTSHVGPWFDTFPEEGASDVGDGETNT